MGDYLASPPFEEEEMEAFQEEMRNTTAAPLPAQITN